MRRQFSGIGASAGLAIAKAFVMKPEVPYEPASGLAADPGADAARFEAAVARSKEELARIRQRTEARLGAEKAEIFEGHLMILEDPDLIDVVLARIRGEGDNAEYALHETAGAFIAMLEQMDDELLRARAADIRDVCGRVMRHLRGVEQADLSLLDEACVIIAEDLAPSDTAQLNPEAVKGFVTAIGSRTSHSAIMARSLDIPAVVGAGAGLLSGVESGVTVILDAESGTVIADPSEEELADYQARKARYDQRKTELAAWVGRATATLDGEHVELAANIGKLADVERALQHGAEGIGLFRTEFLYMGRSELPDEEEQFASYKYVLEKMAGKPVVIRTLDIGGDKELPYMNLPRESNPFLGQRALRLCLARPDLFRVQLRALLRASRYGNLKIMFPMIAVLSELREAKRMLEEERARLAAEGVEMAARFEVGMMIEVPSAALSADLFAPEVDFFSIGTNDLIQYTMAADRMNETVSYLYQPCNPSILRLVRMVIQAARAHGKWVGMCGEMAGDPAAIPLLLGLGLHEFSMSAGSILPTRELLAGLSRVEWSRLAEQALAMPTQEDTLAFVQAHVKGGSGS